MQTSILSCIRKPDFQRIAILFLAIGFLFLFLSPENGLRAQESELSYSVRFGVISGSYDTDLEERWRNDIVFGSLLAKGFGFTTAWSGKEAGGSTIGGSIYYKDFEFFLNSNGISAAPSWIEYYSIPSSGTSTTTMYFNDLTLNRGDADLGAAYTFFKKDGHKLSGRLFRKSRVIEGDLSAFGVFSIPSSGASTILLRSGSIEALAAGLGYGLGYSFTMDKHEFLAGLSLYSMAGTWKYSQTVLSTSSLTLSDEDGNYKIIGNLLELGYRYQVAKDWRFFAIYTQDSAQVTDSDVMNYAIVLSQTSNPTVSFNVLTYPGSTQLDRLSTIKLGVEYLF